MKYRFAFNHFLFNFSKLFRWGLWMIFTFTWNSSIFISWTILGYQQYLLRKVFYGARWLLALMFLLMKSIRLFLFHKTNLLCLSTLLLNHIFFILNFLIFDKVAWFHLLVHNADRFLWIEYQTLYSMPLLLTLMTLVIWNVAVSVMEVVIVWHVEVIILLFNILCR